jgi:basic membrane protein A
MPRPAWAERFIQVVSAPLQGVGFHIVSFSGSLKKGENNMLKKPLFSLILAAGIAISGSALAETKVGYIYVGPIGDHGYSYQHDQSRLAVEKELGVKTSYVESVPEGADAERVIRQLAASGHDIIFTTSFGFMNPTIKVAKNFPKIKFEHATGYKRSANVSTYSARFYEGRTILGTIAGKMTKSNVVGYIGSFPIPEVIRGIDAFTLALRKVNPEATVKVIWVNSWFDPGKEGDAAKTLIDQGVDIIAQHTDSPAPLQVAESRGVYAFGQASDMKAFAPKAQLTSIIDNWNSYCIDKVKAVMNGTWESTDSWYGLKQGMVEMAPYGDAVPADVRKLADEVKQSIIDGTLHPFQGPIKDQKGELVVKAGEVISDEDLLKLSWYVEGVEGSIPK